MRVGTGSRRRILGTPVDDVGLMESVARVRGWLDAEPRRFHQVVTVNPEFVILARRHAAFRAVLEQSDLATPDGIGVVLAGRVLGQPVPERVGGNDLSEALIASGDSRLRFYFLGAHQLSSSRAPSTVAGSIFTPGPIVLETPTERT